MSSDASSSPGQRIDREYLHRRREAEIAAHLESARRALDGEHDNNEAQRALDDAMILDPDDSRALALWDRLETARANGDRSSSTDLPTRWLTASGSAVAILLVSAVLFWQTGLFDSGPGRAGERLLASAQAATDEGRYEEAVALFSEALLLDREDTRAAAGLATSVNSTGRRNTSMMRCCDAGTETEKVRPGGSTCDAFAWPAAGSGACGAATVLEGDHPGAVE